MVQQVVVLQPVAVADVLMALFIFFLFVYLWVVAASEYIVHVFVYLFGQKTNGATFGCC